MADREHLIDVALDLCVRQGYEATTIDQIAAAAGVPSPLVNSYFASIDAIVFSVSDDELSAAVAALADIPPDTDPTEAVIAAHMTALADITNGVGVITRERLHVVAEILTASPSLAKRVNARGKEVFAVALAKRMGVTAEDRRVRLAVTIAAAVIAGAYNVDRGPQDLVAPGDDGRVPEVMVKRLSDTFTEVTGRPSPHPNPPPR
jgi:AcrR family transcriptional regulator